MGQVNLNAGLMGYTREEEEEADNEMIGAFDKDYA